MFKLSYNGRRPYQHETITAILNKQAEGVTNQLIHLPTGSGKTIVIANLSEEIKGRILVLTHRRILVEQTKEKILLVDSNADIGIIQGSRNELDNRIIIASVPTIGKQPSKENGYDRLLDLPIDFEMVIVDEAHHSIAQTWRRVFQYLGIIDPLFYPSNDIKNPTRPIKSANRKATLVGFTATPYRTDNEPLKKVYDEVVFHRPIFDFIPEYLSDCIFANIEQELIINGEKTSSSQIPQNELNAVLKKEEAKQLILDTYIEYCEDRKYAVGFAINIKEANIFADLFNSYNISSAVVHSKLTKEKTEKIFEDFKLGKIKVLWNVNMLTEGFDFAPIDLILICKALPTRKSGSDKDIENDGDLIFTQIIGRGTRIAESKKNCLILDFGALLSSEARTEMLSRTADLFGIPVEDVDLKKSAVELKKEKVFRFRRKREIEHGKLKLTQLMDTQQATRYSKYNYPWVSTYHAYHLLTINPKQSFKIIITDDSKLKYDIIFKDNYKDIILNEGLELENAVLEVEQFIKDKKLSIKYIDPKEQWLKLPATQAQKYALQKRKISFNEKIKRGEASHLITRYDVEITPFAQNLESNPKIFIAYNELLPNLKDNEIQHLVGILDQGMSFESKERKYHSIKPLFRYRAIYKILKYFSLKDFQDISEYFVNEGLRKRALEIGLKQIQKEKSVKNNFL